MLDIIIVVMISSIIFVLFFITNMYINNIIDAITNKSILILKYTPIIIPIRYDIATIKSGLFKWSSLFNCPYIID